MSVYLEMAQRLRQEIAAAQAHLDRLQVALAGIEPLITIDDDAAQGPLGLEFETRRPRRATRPVMAEVLDVEPTLEADDTTPPQNRPSEDAAPAPSGRASAARPRGTLALEQLTHRQRRPRAATSKVVPSTGGAYWTKLMGRRKLTLTEVVDKAIVDLGVPADTHGLLANRLSAWLYPALKAGRIEEAGLRGRHKLYRVAG